MPKLMIAVLGGTLAVVIFLAPVQAQNPSAVLPRSGMRPIGGRDGGPFDAVKNISNLPTLQPSTSPVTNVPPVTPVLPTNLPTLKLEPKLIHITNKDERFMKPAETQVLTNENNSIRIVSPSSVPSP